MAKIPERIGPYKVSSSLGRGGTSQVYRAVHPTLKKTVVLKKLTLRRGTTLQERFKREAELMMALQHPNIVRVFDCFKEGRSWVIVQEYVEGLNLAQLIHLKEKLPATTAAWILYQCARALHYVHRQGIIHRDIKPSNIFISKDGEVKLGDFGIAARVDDSQGLTQEGAALGTPAYMPPEQVLDPANVDKRADVFALGMSFFEALTGSGFQRNLRTLATLMLSFNGRTIEKALRKRAWLRYQSLRLMKLRLRLACPGTPGKNREALKLSMAQGRGRVTEVQSRTLSIKPATSILLFLLLVSLPPVGIYSLKEWISPRRFGLMQLQLVLPENSPSWLQESPSASLYKQQGEQLLRPRNIPLRLNREGTLLQSRRRYFAPGYYRLELRYMEGLEWISFYLPHRLEQKNSEEPLLLIKSLMEEVEPVPLALDVQVRDGLNGQNLNAVSTVEIWTDQEHWEPLSTLRSSLLTDRSYSLRIHTPGYQDFYQTQYFSVRQRHALLKIAMVPKPSLLYLEGPADGVGLRIDGESRYLSLEEVPVWKTLRFDGEPLRLKPSSYLLEFRYRGETFPLEVALQPGQTRWIKWSTLGETFDIQLGE